MLKSVIKKIIPGFLLNWYYRFFPAFGVLLYGFPSRKLAVIGITGTNGKSTVVELLTSILKEAGHNVCSISSIRFQLRDKIWQNKLKMTMPGRMQIQRFLRKAVNQGCQYAVIEITSEGIKQFRHLGINFKTAVLTNLTKEHIESHGGFGNYKKAKGELFRKADNLVVNVDDPSADYFLSFKGRKYGYSLGNAKRDFRVLKPQDIGFNLKLKGRFNIYNALAAACAALVEVVPVKDIKAGLEKVESISGRLEKASDKPLAYVDYAHTPDALEQVYTALSGNRKLICVLGSCGGGRDKWKRPELGKIASDHCSKIILTNEDPYDEDPEQILRDIAAGVRREYETIIDRREAIKRALNSAGPEDTVIITGKGREPWMCVAKGEKIPWDDKAIVEQNLKKR